MKTREDFERLVEKAFDEQERGESIVFATVERGSGRVIGSTRFMNIDRINRRVEIGSTWIAPAVAAHRRQYRSKISDAAARLRSVGMHSRRTENRRTESEITHTRFCASAPRKKEPCAGT